MRDVDGRATGSYYNAVWKIWSNEPIWISVTSDHQVVIQGGDSLIESISTLGASDVSRFEDCLRKSQAWRDKAKDLQLETRKDLGQFTGINLAFHSYNKGADADVIMNITDYRNQSKNIDLYLNPEQVSQLIALFEKIPETSKLLLENDKKANLLN